MSDEPRKLPAFLESLLGQARAQYDRDAGRVHKRAESYAAHAVKAGRPVSTEMAYLAALIDELVLLRNDNRDLETRLRKLEGGEDHERTDG